MVKKLQRTVQHSRLVTEGALTTPSPEKPKGRSSDRNLEKGAVWREPPAGAVVFSKGALPTLVAPWRERCWGKECSHHSLPTCPSSASASYWPNSSGSQRTGAPVAMVHSDHPTTESREEKGRSRCGMVNGGQMMLPPASILEGFT